MVNDSIIRFSTTYQHYSEQRRREIREALEKNQSERLKKREEEIKENKR